MTEDNEEKWGERMKTINILKKKKISQQTMKNEKNGRRNEENSNWEIWRYEEEKNMKNNDMWWQLGREDRETCNREEAERRDQWRRRPKQWRCEMNSVNIPLWEMEEGGRGEEAWGGRLTAVERRRKTQNEWQASLCRHGWMWLGRQTLCMPGNRAYGEPMWKRYNPRRMKDEEEKAGGMEEIACQRKGEMETAKMIRRKGISYEENVSEEKIIWREGKVMKWADINMNVNEDNVNNVNNIREMWILKDRLIEGRQ